MNYSVLKVMRTDGRKAAEVLCKNNQISPLWCETESLTEFFNTVASDGLVTVIRKNSKQAISIKAIPGKENFIDELTKFLQHGCDYTSSVYYNIKPNVLTGSIASKKVKRFGVKTWKDTRVHPLLLHE